jgi:hypothetical protein
MKAKKVIIAIIAALVMGIGTFIFGAQRTLDYVCAQHVAGVTKMIPE